MLGKRRPATIRNGSPASRYSVEVGTLRTLFALAVVFSHAGLGLWFVGARNAVQLFYISSGFLISYVLLHNPAYRNTRVFFVSRALRLYPVYTVVAALALVAAIAVGGPVATTYAQLPDAAEWLLSIVNAIVIGQDWLLFLEWRDGFALTANFAAGAEPNFGAACLCRKDGRSGSS